MDPGFVVLAPARVGAVLESPPAPAPADALRRPSSRARRGVQIAREIVMWAVAVFGIAVAGITVYAMAHDYRPLVVRSGSMEPAIATGGMVLTKPVDADQLAVGDIASVPGADGKRVTHRIHQLERDGDVAVLTLKGDANQDADPHPVRVRDAAVVVSTLPAIGRLAAHVATPLGGLVIGGMLGMGARGMRSPRTDRRT